MPFNIDKAIKYIISTKKPESVGYCVEHVRRAIIHGGINAPGGNSGVKFAKTCKQIGFSLVNDKVRLVGRTIQGAKPGDICCSRSTTAGSKYKRGPYVGQTIGHSCMYTGSTYGWVSDYAQYDKAIPYSSNVIQSGEDRVTVWRYIGGTYSGNEDAIINGADLTDSSLAGGLYSSVDSEARQKLQELYLKVLQQNAYPVHSDYLTFSSEYGNLFKASENDAITRAAFVNSSILNENDKLYREDKTNIQGRIYSTNDTLLVLDELSLPSDYKNDIYVSSNVKDSERKQKQSNYDHIKKASDLPGNIQKTEEKPKEDDKKKTDQK